MAKTCPSCGYHPIGPFIDNCPICAEPVRNVRSGDGGCARPANLSPLLRCVVVGAVVAALVVAVRFGLDGGRRGPMLNEVDQAAERAKAAVEADRRARTVVVAAAQLLRDFQNNPAAADQKYNHKYLEISGLVERSGRDRDGIPFVILHAGDEHAGSKIECFFDLADDEDETHIDRLRNGQTASVRGEYSGRISNVQIRDCVLVK